MIAPAALQHLRGIFGPAFQENVPTGSFSTARTGGPADGVLVAHTAAELEHFVQQLWQTDIQYVLLGSGSNVLFGDGGFRGVVVINKANTYRFDTGEKPSAWAESGTNLGALARQAALRGLSGLEWAATVPGTVGGAVYGNAGAHGGDMAGSLIVAEILHHDFGKVSWSAQQLEYAYRSSKLKREPALAVILSASVSLMQSDPVEIQLRMSEFSQRRRATQPPGASMGSMFKNPPGDYAGRLIEACGLKGARIGGAQISPVHANFFVNDEGAAAGDVRRLIELARSRVKQQFGIDLELEIELLGEWHQPSSTNAEG